MKKILKHNTYILGCPNAVLLWSPRLGDDSMRGLMDAGTAYAVLASYRVARESRFAAESS